MNAEIKIKNENKFGIDMKKFVIVLKNFSFSGICEFVDYEDEEELVLFTNKITFGKLYKKLKSKFVFNYYGENEDYIFYSDVENGIITAISKFNLRPEFVSFVIDGGKKVFVFNGS